MSITNDIKQMAMEAGFHAVGIADAADLTDSGRSIVSVALSYLTDDDQPPAASSQRSAEELFLPPVAPSARLPVVSGKVARFARGKDYHDALDTRLLALADSIRAYLGKDVEIKTYADTGPRIDRSAAIRSGIGNQGKNSCVYVGEYGSWVVLGELVTDLELKPDKPEEKDICGVCEKCMKACPTGAIVEPYKIDESKCLSRITQGKGVIPIEIREKMGTRVYGCDVCQEVCPLNRGSKPGNLPEMRASAGIGSSPDLVPLLNMTSAEFEEKIKPTTAGWIGRNRFRRNVAIALGNAGDTSAVPALEAALFDESPLVRGHAAWALGKLGVRGTLEAALEKETVAEVISEIRAALAHREHST